MRLLDLFCGAGGAAMGYSRAGFEVVGVDNRLQPRYPFEFHQADALEYVAEHWNEFDAIHASPPCQFYSRLRHLPWLRDKVYWRSIPPTREALIATGRPYIIENVEDACWDMVNPPIICGQAIGLNLYRHRCFEAWPMLLLAPSHQKHTGRLAAGKNSMAQRYAVSHVGVKEPTGVNAWNGVAGHQAGMNRHHKAMGIDWMTNAELAQAIPPTMTELVGKQLMAYLELTPRGE